MKYDSIRKENEDPRLGPWDVGSENKGLGIESWGLWTWVWNDQRAETWTKTWDLMYRV